MTTKYNNVFIEDAYTVCGNYENDGPLSKYFDKKHKKDLYFGEKSWEKAEVHLLKEANENILKKNKLKEKATIKVPSTSIQYLLPIFFLLTLVIILSTFFFLK